MTPALDWFGAPFEAHGGTSGEGARRLLGQPSLDPLTVLVRETIQNSWDARMPSSGRALAYSIGLRTLDNCHQRVLREEVFGANRGRGGLGLQEALQEGPLRVIEVCDSGTSGLAGPIRADVEPAENQPTDFVDFIFNIGTARDTDLGGGTYGFGKTIAYVVSRVATIVVASCVEGPGGSLEHRFIASAIGSEFVVDGFRFTGRQWWGCLQEGRIGPVTGATAHDLASALGLPADHPGTRILVLDPDLRDRSSIEAMQFISSSIVWHAWPKLLSPPTGGSPPMEVSARLDGRDFEVPDPRSESRLRPFVRSLQQVRALQDGTESNDNDPLPSKIHPIACGRPKQDLGHLGLAFAPNVGGLTNNGEEDADRTTDACPLRLGSHHVALMRQAELIVMYLEGPPSSVDGFEWGGAFRCLTDVDNHFAKAEPPAHEGWDPEFVSDDWGRTFVRVALREIKKAARTFATPAEKATGSGGSVSTARIGDLLSGMIPSVEGTGLSHRQGGGHSSGRRGNTGRSRVDLNIGPMDYLRGADGAEVRIELAVDAPGGKPTVVEVDVGVRNDTGRESSAPEGAVPPRLGRLRSPDGTVIEPDARGRFRVPEGSGAAWFLSVFTRDVAALDLDIAAYVDSPSEAP